MATPNKVAQETKLEMLRRWYSGESQTEIARSMQLNRATIAAHLRATLGVETPEHWQGGRVAIQRPKIKSVRPAPFVYPENPAFRKRPFELAAGEFERFWAKVAAANINGCRLWLASFGGSGSGQFGTKGKNQIAYRVAWRLAYGPIPKGMQVNHRCDVRACVEPTHLWLGTQADNLADMAAKGRSRIGRKDGQRGEANVTAKLTWQKVREIRKLREEHGVTLDEIAERFGISKSQASNITTYKQWVE